MTRRFNVEHALRVAEDGRVEVTKAPRARLQFSGDIKPVVVD
jgi:thiamine biosynthesis lipoprotein